MYKALCRVLFVIMLGNETIIRKLLPAVGCEISEYEAVKSFSNDFMCAITSTPSETIRKSSSISCANRCQQCDRSYCFGFNFKADIKTCELISSDPLTFGILSGCSFFKVSSFSNIHFSKNFVKTWHELELLCKCFVFMKSECL
jgi:hypothetical protein